MPGLAELDVQQSLAHTIEALLKAAAEVDAQLGAAGVELSQAGKGTLELIATKVEEAETFYARALDSKALYDRLAQIHTRLGDSASAERYAKQGRMFLADELEFKGRLEAFYGNNARALELFQQALKLVNDHAFALKGAQGSAKRVERSRKDLEKLKKAAETRKASKDFVALGAAYADLARLDDALGAFDEALRADPNNPDAWARKGTALHAKGNVTEALALYRKALAIKPTSMLGRRGVNYATFQIENPGKRGGE